MGGGETAVPTSVYGAEGEQEVVGRRDRERSERGSAMRNERQGRGVLGLSEDQSTSSLLSPLLPQIRGLRKGGGYVGGGGGSLPGGNERRMASGLEERWHRPAAVSDSSEDLWC